MFQRITRVLVIPFVALLAVSSGGCALLTPTDQNVIGQANQVHGSLQPAVIRDAQVQRYMDAIGQRIVDGAIAYNESGKEAKAQRGQDNSWMYNGGVKFHLVNSQTLNAFTTGGQHIYIYNQLFQDAATEDELAAVMAHEFAHVYARHVHSGMQRQYGVLGLTALGRWRATPSAAATPAGSTPAWAPARPGSSGRRWRRALAARTRTRPTSSASASTSAPAGTPSASPTSSSA
jgi:predicted Zn-dependent protease